ncbi:metalloregulator ArsR/SmtB family transcription factor [Kribbella sp. NPDC050459]|uniref:ArsR/SmtB family transcription factor n=1 Tax=Kribbella sp. NPDC050459 TaxID=3155785 RepID=UPI00340D5C6B
MQEKVWICWSGGWGLGEHAAKALASGRRAELVDVLAQGERPVEELAAEIGPSVANTSHHLQRLLRARLVRTRRSGTHIYYALASPSVVTLWLSLRAAGEAHVVGLGWPGTSATVRSCGHDPRRVDEAAAGG